MVDAYQVMILKTFSSVEYPLPGEYGTQVANLINTYTGAEASMENLGVLRDGLQTIINSFNNDTSSNIGIHKAITDILLVCDAILAKESLGSVDEFHDSSASHTVYRCTGTDDTNPQLIYEVTANLSSYNAAENACYNLIQANPGADYYFAYTNSCAGVVLSFDPINDCLAGKDLLIN